VQGGAFSEHSGLFYMVSNVPKIGLMMWDWKNWKDLGIAPINFSPNLSEFIEELEGITIWNADSKGAPNITGQVHVVMINQAASDGVPAWTALVNPFLYPLVKEADTIGNVWIKHFDVNREK
jgi:hypothetical protein